MDDLDAAATNNQFCLMDCGLMASPGYICMLPREVCRRSGHSK